MVIKNKNLILSISAFFFLWIMNFELHASGFMSNNEYNEFLDWKNGKKILEMEYGEVAKVAFSKGIIAGVQDTAKLTVQTGFGFVPNFLKRLGILSSALIYKLAYGSRGLTFDTLSLNSEQIRRIVDPFTKKSYASNDRVKRMTEINQDMNNEVKDINWDLMQDKIKKIITNLHAMLSRSLPCYDVRFNDVGILRQCVASVVHLFSTQDNEQISRVILSTLSDLETLQKYIISFKSMKDVEQNTEHLQKWLQIVLLDIQQLGSLIDNDAMSASSGNRRAAYPPLNQGNLGNMSQLNELLSANGG